MNSALYLADLLALHTLNANLTRCLNHCRFGELSDFFAEDATYIENDLIAIGHAAIRDFLETSASRSPARYDFNAPCIELTEGAYATGTCLRVAYVRNSEGSLAFSVYDVNDHYTLCLDERWRIVRREIQFAL